MIELVIDQRRKDLGGGFEVGRVLPFAKRRAVGPFVFFDRMGPVDMPAGIPMSMDVRPHPHIGISTLSYLFDGEITHRDSLGYHQDIRPGEVNWMTAGSGVTHSERLERARREGARMEGIQAWVGLPDGQEEVDPSFEHHAGSSALPTWKSDGVSGRLVAGETMGMKAAVGVYSPLHYLHLDMDPGARFQTPTEHSESAVYVVSGLVEIDDGRPLGHGQMAVLEKGIASVVCAQEPSVVMILGGEPLGQRFIDWNFVSSSKDRLEQAKADWRAGRMKLPDMDDQEFIPLPE
ncbi:MAG TPA: pirin family protein [Brevundimonas sp.]|uniref:pirin family protein n=1 Tax=Brevundimonas sp. TaxID=1871086 RepID=UPI002BA63AB4|nr:pirin family protein [Brevundimonas sp.]HRH20932.1 pirin family protein [Brevundimonas sp.]